MKYKKYIISADAEKNIWKIQYYFTYRNTQQTRNGKKQLEDVDKDVEKLEPLKIIGGDIKWCSYYGKHQFLKKL